MKKPLKENFMPVKYFPMGIIPVAHVINAPPASPRTKLKSVSTGLRMVAARIFGRATKGRAVDTHHVDGVKLLGDSHAADFRSNAGPHLARQDQCYHCGTEFQYHAFTHHIADKHSVQKWIFHVGCGLDYQDASHKQGNDTDNDNRRHYQPVCFYDELLPEHAAFLRFAEHLPEKERVLSY